MSFLDKREFKNGMSRYRFTKLTEQDSKFIEDTFRSTGCQYNNTALSFVCSDYMAMISLHGKTFKHYEGEEGNKRLLIQVYQDEVEEIDFAFDVAMKFSESSSKALISMCMAFNYFNSVSKIDG